LPTLLRAPSQPAGEDLWHAYNLIREGDRVEATTFRKVLRDTGAGGESERIKLKLMIAVEGVEYDAEGEPSS
jgi:protein pelota